MRNPDARSKMLGDQHEKLAPKRSADQIDPTIFFSFDLWKPIRVLKVVAFANLSINEAFNLNPDSEVRSWVVAFLGERFIETI
ncbi:hypothetical protein ACMD2_01180 [Ananas comosus]|uniref:Uncharacterized protein n=1 Tax=Ananas comosus TaxID=4615 RepID=A0A199UDF6_ANACO|nr:hypothetical protein ACMD2_01180 [Ananas comosus]